MVMVLLYEPTKANSSILFKFQPMQTKFHSFWTGAQASKMELPESLD